MVKLDDTIHKTVENTSPQELSNVDVYLSNSRSDPFLGEVRNMVYSSEDTTGCSYLGKLSEQYLPYLENISLQQINPYTRVGNLPELEKDKMEFTVPRRLLTIKLTTVRKTILTCERENI